MEKKKNYNLVIGLAALVAIVLIIAFVGYLLSKPKPHIIQGEAEAAEYRVSCMVPGHVTELYCREGQEVSKGDTVAFIDSPQVRAKLAQAEDGYADILWNSLDRDNRISLSVKEGNETVTLNAREAK